MMERKWDIRTIYLYLVSFVTLMMVLFGTVNALQAGFEYFFQPPELYAQILPDAKIMQGREGVDAEKAKETARLEQERMERNMRYSILRSLFNSAATIAVGLPVYLYHWRVIKRKENDNEIK